LFVCVLFYIYQSCFLKKKCCLFSVPALQSIAKITVSSVWGSFAVVVAVDLWLGNANNFSTLIGHVFWNDRPSTACDATCSSLLYAALTVSVCVASYQIHVFRRDYVDSNTQQPVKKPVKAPAGMISIFVFLDCFNRNFVLHTWYD
jgi:hypothetical protein